MRSGRILKIVDQDEAHKHSLPVRKGADPALIPSDDQMVTQIIPVRYADAVELIESLEPLLPDEATLTADQSSNAIVITDRQASINRFARIVMALDTSISGISTVKVYALQYAEAGELEDVIEDIFEQPRTSDRGRSSRGGFPFGFSRGGDRGGGEERQDGESQARQAALHVEAEADERTNSLVVTAPEEYIPIIDQVIEEIDRNVDDITEIQVFALEHADAQETAQLITSLFDDQAEQASVGNRFGGRFGPGFLFGRGGPTGGGDGQRGGGQQGQGSQNSRLQQQERVVAVADPRTNAVIVIAASTLMPQIGQMVGRLDSDSSRRQKVYVYSLEHADVDNVAEILRGMFEDRLSGASRAATRGNNQQNNPLNNRTINPQTIGGLGQ